MANPSKVQAVVKRITAYGNGVYLVDFATPARYNRYLPGQFLHLTLDAFDPTTGFWPESRVFSIASEPRQEQVTIVFSVKGAYTKRMEQELKVGQEVWLKFPYGDFTIDPSQGAGPLVLVAGGTGVSPYRPFLLKALESGVNIPVILYYGVRQPDHLLFAEDWQRLVDQAPWFSLRLASEVGSVPELASRTGRLDIGEIWAELGDQAPGAAYYLSGPPIMIKNFRQGLEARGVAQKSIHIDEWE